MAPFAFSAYVPLADWLPPKPAVTHFDPGHDARVLAPPGSANATSIDVRIEYNMEMNCQQVLAGMSFRMSKHATSQPTFGTPTCATFAGSTTGLRHGVEPSAWYLEVTLSNVPDGIFEVIVNNAPAQDTTRGTTGVKDHFMIRKGAANNPMVFPSLDYDNSVFTETDSGYLVNHTAIGADRIRYTWNYGQNWTDWYDWEATTVIKKSEFPNGFWVGQHIILEYWNEIASAGPVRLHADIGYHTERRVPTFIARGPFNNWGYDAGVENEFKQTTDNPDEWSLQVSGSWPTILQLCVFGYNDNFFYGDVDGDGVIDRLPPASTAPNFLNMSAPPHPHVAWKVVVNDATGAWKLVPQGDSMVSAVMFALLLLIPPLTAVLACLVFKWRFYGIKTNEWGVKPEKTSSYFPIMEAFKSKTGAMAGAMAGAGSNEKSNLPAEVIPTKSGAVIGWPEDPKKPRRKVLIASLEYEILDWKLKVKIGGLGVMSTLMGKAMTDVDLIWVVPKVKDLEYPAGEYADPIEVTIFGESYLIESVQPALLPSRPDGERD